MAVTPDGRRAVSASRDQNAAALGPGERPNAPHARKAIRDAVSAVAVTPDGRRAVSASG